jgi:hypothetical protein
MSESDSPFQSCVSGDGGRPSPRSDRIRGRELVWRGWQPLKSCQAGPVVRLLLLSVALATVSAFLAWHATNRCEPQDAPADNLGNASGLAVLLRDKLPEARIVSTRADGQIDRSFILTVGGWDGDTLRRLPRVPDRAGEWSGTVLCEWLVNWEPAELFLEEWGEYGFARPPFVFFGDKELLARIREALR